jgi:hypothetical protein
MKSSGSSFGTARILGVPLTLSQTQFVHSLDTYLSIATCLQTLFLYDLIKPIYEIFPSAPSSLQTGLPPRFYIAVLARILG